MGPQDHRKPTAQPRHSAPFAASFPGKKQPGHHTAVSTDTARRSFPKRTHRRSKNDVVPGPAEASPADPPRFISGPGKPRSADPDMIVGGPDSDRQRTRERTPNGPARASKTVPETIANRTQKRIANGPAATSQTDPKNLCAILAISVQSAQPLSRSIAQGFSRRRTASIQLTFARLSHSRPKYRARILVPPSRRRPAGWASSRKSLRDTFRFPDKRRTKRRPTGSPFRRSFETKRRQNSGHAGYARLVS